MKRLIGGALVGVAAAGVCFASSDSSNAGNAAKEECATTRDVQTVIVNLRDHGWTSQRIADAVLSVSKTQDEDTRQWFLGLVRQAYDLRTTSEDIEIDFQRCLVRAPQASRLSM